VKTHPSKVGLVLLVIVGVVPLVPLLAGPTEARAPDGSFHAGSAAAAAPALDPLLYRHVAQITWVVSDIDRVVDYWQKLGIHNLRRQETVSYPNLKYRGQPDPASARQVTARVGELEIRWIQPVHGGRFWRDSLRTHRDGIRVLSYIAQSPQQFDDQIQYFKSKGVDVLVQNSWQGPAGPARFAYLDTSAQGGGHILGLLDDPEARAATSGAGNEYPLTQITHFAWVVNDVKKVDAYYTSLGFQPFSRIDHNVSLDRIYRGHPGTYEMWLGWDRTGDAPFEWVQQITGPDVYVEFAKTHGEGFHHLGVNVADMDGAIQLMTARGAPPSQLSAWNTPKGKGRAVYLDTEPYGGVTLELIYDPTR
jgi:methylmalonyl-CoA/ethylmalonyl-CoA epimerase